MSSNNRAHNREVRKKMAATGANFTRAGRAVPPRPSRPLKAVCFTCKTDVPDGGGVIHIQHGDVHRVERALAEQVEQRAAKVTAEGQSGRLTFLTLADLMDQPDEARWQVHCDACNPHAENGCEGCYWFGVERCRTWSQLIDWTAHLIEKEWVLNATDWTQFIRAAAHGTSEVGLICHPSDRYKDA
ncbi:hypothetical protein BS329_41605 [Amycolatopsis coloradensis]|uniref:Uncharacterized protein n=1 Tax=Amycolatopsis coloradensis TaxID=76021 RepID=A0A1R0KD24_9PSEU|nr:hypothetical protein [Amycolatopsis coloradensis]OLZ42789.1 hypothetical protein BS329_41605 [Amycolatopsis coloradensis]